MSRILVCEDQDSIRKMIEALVKARGHEVCAVQSGAQALEEAVAKAPDIALLDLTMPGDFDGFEVCRRLRSTKETEDIPIIIVSALDDDISRDRARECGASAYFTKPFSPTKLLAAIQTHVRS
ncbi:MAG: response regulator [Polyangiaceae bacterium]|nr:response regulator [Polyangiaceae bacterium]